MNRILYLALAALLVVGCDDSVTQGSNAEDTGSPGGANPAGRQLRLSSASPEV